MKEYGQDLQLTAVSNTTENVSPAALCACAIGALALYGGLLGAFYRSYGAEIYAPAVILGALGALGGAYGIARRGRWGFLPLCQLLAAALFCLLLWPQVRSGGASLINTALTACQARDAYLYLPLSGGSGEALWAALPACVVLGTALGMLASLWPQGGLALTLASVVLTAAGRWVGGPWLLAMAFGAAVLSLGGRRSGGRGAGAAHLGGASLLLAAAMASSLVGGVLGGGLDTAAAARGLESAVHHLRYEDGQQALPEGDFYSERRGAAETSMLRVTLSQPVSLYLRGYVGQRYTRQGWQRADNADMASGGALFYQLRQAGYGSFTQLSTLASLLQMEEDAVVVQVEVTSACRESYITPYELSSGAVLDAQALPDTLPTTRSLTGARQYSYTVSPDLTARAYELLHALDQRRTEASLADYLTFEAYYRDFVYENNLAIPETTCETLRSFLGDAPETITSYEAKRRIIDCLDGALTYSDSADALPQGEDFLTALLRDGGCGGDVQYATAAVMMLRYYGIPARYVEGYLITPSALEGHTGETILTLTGGDAHAWAEYYEDGVGWVPFEAAPAYRGVMDEMQWLWFEEDENASLAGGALPGGEDGQTARRSDVQEDAPQESEVTVQTIAAAVADYFSRRHMGRKLLLLLPAALLGAALVLALRRRRIGRARQRRFAQEDVCAAVAAMAAYALELMWRSGLRRENVSLFAMQGEMQAWAGESVDCGALLWRNARALYGGAPMDETTRTQMRGDMETVLRRCKMKLKPWRRLYEKWLRCLY